MKPTRYCRFLNRLFIAQLVFLIFIVAGSTSAYAFFESIEDETIELEVRRQLMVNELISSHLIDIDVEDGVVSLSGTVDHLLAKDQAIEIAESIKGVQDIKNRLMVKPAFRSDKAVQNDVISALAVDPAADAYDVTVTVSNGVVYLKGEADSFAEMNIATRVAKGVKGVIKVINKLEIQYDAIRNDSEIKAEIERSFELNPAIREDKMNVAVTNGIVTLSGFVGSLSEKNEAEVEAMLIGVRDVINNLTIDWQAATKILADNEPTLFKSDEEIREDIEDALMLQPEVDSENIYVRVKNAVATLSGTVNNYNARIVAEDTAYLTTGVRRVKNYLQVRLDRAAKDEDIEKAVREALDRNPVVDVSEIKINVLNQKVYLSGIVDTHFEKQQAENAVSRIIHVASVQNSIIVDKNLEWKTDMAIKEDIQDELFWSPFVDHETIVVSVENGEAKLTGSVLTWNEHNNAVKNAFEGGALTVKSYLQVTQFPGTEDYVRTYEYASYINSL